MRNITLVALVFMTSLDLWAGNLLDITKSCKNLKIEKSSLSAECKANNGGTYKTKLRLRGVNNRNGDLIVENDSKVKSVFHLTCKDVAIDSYGVLAGRCLKEKNSENYKWTYLNLSELIFNYNGTLVYPVQ